MFFSLVLSFLSPAKRAFACHPTPRSFAAACVDGLFLVFDLPGRLRAHQHANSYRGLGMSIANMSVLTGLQFPLTGMVTKAITGGETRRLSFNEMVASAFVGGALSGIACGPMELVMIQQQRYGLGIFETPQKLVAEAGAASLSRGLLMSCGRESLFCAGYLGMGPAFSRELEEGKGWSAGSAKFVGCVGAGVIAALTSHPMDTIKTCMQGDVQGLKYGTVTETAKALHAEGGIGAFYKVCSPFLLFLWCSCYQTNDPSASFFFFLLCVQKKKSDPPDCNAGSLNL